jgi:hypothetical protein
LSNWKHLPSSVEVIVLKKKPSTTKEDQTRNFRRRQFGIENVLHYLDKNYNYCGTFSLLLARIHITYIYPRQQRRRSTQTIRSRWWVRKICGKRGNCKMFQTWSICRIKNDDKIKRLCFWQWPEKIELGKQAPKYCEHDDDY